MCGAAETGRSTASATTAPARMSEGPTTTTSTAPQSRTRSRHTRRTVTPRIAGPGMTCRRRLAAWNEAGAWDELHLVLLKKLDWSRPA